MSIRLRSPQTGIALAVATLVAAGAASVAVSAAQTSGGERGGEKRVACPPHQSQPMSPPQSKPDIPLPSQPPHQSLPKSPPQSTEIPLAPGCGPRP